MKKIHQKVSIRTLFLFIVFLFEIAFLQALPEALIFSDSRNYTVTGYSQFENTSTGGIPQDRRKTAPEMRKHIRTFIALFLLIVYAVATIFSHKIKLFPSPFYYIQIFFGLLYDMKEIVAFFYNYRSCS